MATLAFQVSTVAYGALSDSLSLCQTALWGAFLGILILFVRDKRQMLRVGLWGMGFSLLGTVMAAYGAFGSVIGSWTPRMAEFIVGLVLFATGAIELYRHELLKLEPLGTQTSAFVFKWARRLVLPILAFFSAIIQPPCDTGPYPLLAHALSVRPGQVVEWYLLIYCVVLFIPYFAILLVWYGLLSIPGVEHFKNRFRNSIRIIVGALTLFLGIYLLWHTRAITLLPGLANIGV